MTGKMIGANLVVSYLSACEHTRLLVFSLVSV